LESTGQENQLGCSIGNVERGKHSFDEINIRFVKNRNTISVNIVEFLLMKKRKIKREITSFKRIKVYSRIKRIN
jgi:hypothetical protein